MRNLIIALGLAGLLLAPVKGHTATLIAKVSLSSQSMTVFHRGTVIGQWKVSTARPGKVTPTGSWQAKWLSKDHRSSRYDNAPMPYSVFYNGHFAVHGTNQISKLGKPASAGCIRLHPDNARTFFNLARREGLQNVRIVVQR